MSIGSPLTFTRFVTVTPPALTVAEVEAASRGPQLVGRVAAPRDHELRLLGLVAVEHHHAGGDDRDVVTRALKPPPVLRRGRLRRLERLPFHERNLQTRPDRDAGESLRVGV